MRSIVRVFAALLLCLAAAPGVAAAADAPAAADPLAPVGWLRELAGACWTATVAGGRMRDTQCYEIQYGRFMRGTIRLAAVDTAGARPPYEGDSVWRWDAASGRIRFTYWSNSGLFGESEGIVDGDAVHFPDPPKVDSSEPDTRSTWTRVGADSFRVVREQREGGGWKPTLTVTYGRVR